MFGTKPCLRDGMCITIAVQSLRFTHAITEFHANNSLYESSPDPFSLGMRGLVCATSNDVTQYTLYVAMK